MAINRKMNVEPGVLYDANYDLELVAERIAAKELCFELNNLRPSMTMKREEIIRRLLGKAGVNCCIESPFYCDYGYNIEVGDNFFINSGCVILDGARLATMYLLPRTAVFIQPGIRSTTNAATWGLNMPFPSPLATMCGLAAMCAFCREFP